MRHETCKHHTLWPQANYGVSISDALMSTPIFVCTDRHLYFSDHYSKH